MGETTAGLSEHERNLLWEQISDLEHRGWRALCGGDAAGFYRDLMTDDGLMVLRDGTVMTRDEVYTSLRESEPWSSFEITEEKLVTPAAGVAVLAYVGTGHRGDGSTMAARMTSTYVRPSTFAAGPWRLALYTQTPLGG